MRAHNGPILKIEDVSLTLGHNNILRGVTAEVHDTIGRGQVIGLLGPSGIGKTQLFRILSGLQEPTNGRILIGKDLKPVQVGQVGVVTQDYLLFEHRTVIDNLTLAGRQAGLSAADAKAKALGFLERFSLTDRANYYPAQLSGGQRQRIAIAQQLMCSEHFLLMDEPFSGLDLIMLEKVCSMIDEVQKLDELNTIVVVTHDVTAAASIADTLWLMGLEYNSDGTPIPGARILETYDLLERGFEWRPGISLEPAFNDFVREVKTRFKQLDPGIFKLNGSAK